MQILRFSIFCASLVFLSQFHQLKNFSRAKSKYNVTDSSIVVIFSKNTLNNIDKKSTFYTANNIRYYQSGLLRVDRDLNNKYKNDTLVINTKQALLPMDLFYNYITFNYYFKKGDTVTFTFESDIPFAVCKNRPVKPTDLNYSLAYKKYSKKPLKGTNVLKLSKDNLTKDDLFNRFYDSFKSQNNFIDSLTKVHALSEGFRTLYDSQNRYEFAGNILTTNLYDMYAPKVPAIYPLEALLNNESLLYDDYFHNFLVWQYLWSNQLNVRKFTSPHGTTLDYGNAYDKIKSTFENLKVKDFLLFYCLQMIQDEQSKQVFNIYFDKFKLDVNDPAYTEYINKNFDKKLVNIPGHSIMSNLQKTRKIDYVDLIKKSKGKVVYVDLWASWCLPCRKAMPASVKLRNRFKNKLVVFVYLSTDSKYTDWEKASNEEGLANYDDNLLLLEPKTAALVKQIALKLIPRYLIYDKKGDLVYDNAPAPDSSEIDETLSKYAAQPF